MNNVIGIVVTYNRLDLLKKCIDKLKAQTNSLDILLIDNASTDGTNEAFSLSKDVIYLNTGSNLGGAGGFNFGIKKAVELGYEYLWILDDDTMPEPAALEELLNKSRKIDGDFGFLSSKVIWKDNNICTMNIQKETKWRRMKEFDKEKKIQYASFVSLFIKSETVLKLGLPYKEFFIWADDWEYTRRISKYKNSYYVPDSVVKHYCESNVGADIVNTPMDRTSRFKYMYRNDYVLYRLDGLEGMFYLFIRNLFHILKILIQAENKKEKLKILFKYSRQGKYFKPNIEYPILEKQV